MIPAFRALRLPRFVMKIYAWYLRYIRRDPIYAGLVDNFYEKSVSEYYALIAKREDYRARWFRVWRDTEVEGARGDEGVDFILTVPNALPAVPHRGMRHGWKACGYTFLFNLVGGRLIVACMALVSDRLVVGVARLQCRRDADYPCQAHRRCPERLPSP